MAEQERQFQTVAGSEKRGVRASLSAPASMRQSYEEILIFFVYPLFAGGFRDDDGTPLLKPAKGELRDGLAVLAYQFCVFDKPRWTLHTEHPTYSIWRNKKFLYS